MKKTKIKQRVANALDAFFAEDLPPGQIAVRGTDFNLQNKIGGDSTSGSFNFWAFAKCLLFYVPGVTTLFFITLALTHFIIFENENVGNFSFAFFWLGFGVFMTMFGIGKLSDLKYLKVVAAILVTSFVIAVPFSFVFDVLKANYSGFYAFYPLPIVLLAGYLMKTRVDGEETEFL